MKLHHVNLMLARICTRQIAKLNLLMQNLIYFHGFLHWRRASLFITNNAV